RTRERESKPADDYESYRDDCAYRRARDVDGAKGSWPILPWFGRLFRERFVAQRHISALWLRANPGRSCPLARAGGGRQASLERGRAKSRPASIAKNRCR